MHPRLGVLAYWPIQYHSPLYQRLAERGNVELDVLYLSDKGYRTEVEPLFGVPISWDIDLLSGYRHDFLNTGQNPISAPRRVLKLTRWIRSQEAVVINGYSSPWMLFAMMLCRLHKVPFLLRASSHPIGNSSGVRSGLRRILTRTVVAGSSAGLSMGILNEQFYRQNHAKRIIFAPNSVDDERFARPSLLTPSEVLARWNLDDGKPVILYCGKLYPLKRPFDIIGAANLLPEKVTTLFVGDGALAEQIRASLRPGLGAVTGFVNQSELPAYYHAADILVLASESETWGLVINEAMAAGVLPISSNRVGAVPDLVEGIGEVYSCGDVADLAAALGRALERIKDPGTRNLMRQHAARYRLDLTAAGFEEAALTVSYRKLRGL